MLRVERVRRFGFFSPMTPGWILGTSLFVAAVLFVPWSNRTLGTHFTVCPMRLALGLPCPLCGGTTASLQLAAGDPVAAFRTNPLVIASLLVSGVWAILWVGLGIRVGTTLRSPVVAALLLLLLAINWAYILSNRP